MMSRLSLVMSVVALLWTGVAARATEVTEGVLLPGTGFSTTWVLVDSGTPGPTVVVVGGMHGNEPAGALAASQIRHWPIDAGRLLVLPRVNRVGLDANSRWIPAHRNDRTRRDLNRNFPTEDRPDPRTDLAREVWTFVSAHEPDWVFDLHEGFDVHHVNPDSVGSSVISFPEEAAFAQMLVDRANELAPEDRPFDLLAGSGPVSGSLARACAERLGAKAFILETTFKDQPRSLRARQHRAMVSMALESIGVLESSRVEVTMPPPVGDVLRVGLFDDSGASEAKMQHVLESASSMRSTLIGRHDMGEASLSQFDVLVFPGGSGSRQGRAIGPEGRAEVRRFVEGGGGIVGICAGAYLCSSHYDWSLDLMNARVFNDMVEIPGVGRKSMWYRGSAAPVEVEIFDHAAPVLGLTGTHAVRYHNGPILSPGDDPDAPPYEVLARFRTEVSRYDAQVGTMVESPAVVTSRFGTGRVIAISPHFESTAGLESVALEAVRWVAPNAGEAP